ncbi:LytTR family DNA-binding domain-containing protein [Chryseobacterium sp.]|uniref:LytR/AlgR family response regulator transcription factor n=1 Tax=Chryseobacterium sp. TaxID=1871047 RepID=UPI0031DBAA97
MSQQLRIVIIEDEAATARDLEFILKEINSGFEITVILQTVRDSVLWLSSNADHYDLIFSDIHLSDGLSFEIFRQILILKPVIFVTAYDGYALEAFRNNGIGYILKPFDKEEINRSLLKYITLTATDNGLEQSKLLALLQQLKSSVSRYKKTFLIHYCGKLIPVEASKIYWFQTSNEMVYAQLENGQKYIVEYTLEQLEQQLNPELFFRANRQFIINKKAIDSIEYFFNGRLSVIIHPAPEEQVLISKAKAPAFRKWIDQ